MLMMLNQILHAKNKQTNITRTKKQQVSLGTNTAALKMQQMYQSYILEH